MGGLRHVAFSKGCCVVMCQRCCMCSAHRRFTSTNPPSAPPLAPWALPFWPVWQVGAYAMHACTASPCCTQLHAAWFWTAMHCRQADYPGQLGQPACLGPARQPAVLDPLISPMPRRPFPACSRPELLGVCRRGALCCFVLRWRFVGDG